jgi:hypothetical protein
MKKKSIEAVICKKIDNWLESITDVNVRRIAKDNCIVSGGCIASMLLDEEINDYDIYFRTKDAAIKVAQYYIDTWKTLNPNGVRPEIKETKIVNIRGEDEERITIFVKSSGTAGDVEAPKKTKGKKLCYDPVFLTDNAITLTDRIQLVIRFFGEPSQIHDNYDFVHAMNYYERRTNKVTFHPEALEAILAKTLVYKGSLYPICSLFRIRKFVERGWRISAGEMLKIVWQVSELNLHDFNTIREQLIGVDVSYMLELISKLKAKNLETVDSAMMTKLINELYE